MAAMNYFLIIAKTEWIEELSLIDTSYEKQTLPTLIYNTNLLQLISTNLDYKRQNNNTMV